MAAVHLVLMLGLLQATLTLALDCTLCFTLASLHQLGPTLRCFAARCLASPRRHWRGELRRLELVQDTQLPPAVATLTPRPTSTRLPASLDGGCCTATPLSFASMLASQCMATCASCNARRDCEHGHSCKAIHFFSHLAACCWPVTCSGHPTLRMQQLCYHAKTRFLYDDMFLACAASL